MAYLLLPGERVGQMVYPGAKRRAFTNDEIELALGGRGYTKIAGRVRQFNDRPHVMLVAAGGGEINREAMRWVKSGDEIRGTALIVAKDQLPASNKKIARAGASRRRARIESDEEQGERVASQTKASGRKSASDVGQDFEAPGTANPESQERRARQDSALSLRAPLGRVLDRHPQL